MSVLVHSTLRLDQALHRAGSYLDIFPPGKGGFFVPISVNAITATGSERRRAATTVGGAIGEPCGQDVMEHVAWNGYGACDEFVSSRFSCPNLDVSGTLTTAIAKPARHQVGSGNPPPIACSVQERSADLQIRSCT